VNETAGCWHCPRSPRSLRPRSVDGATSPLIVAHVQRQSSGRLCGTPTGNCTRRCAPAERAHVGQHDRGPAGLTMHAARSGIAHAPAADSHSGRRRLHSCRLRSRRPPRTVASTISAGNQTRPQTAEAPPERTRPSVTSPTTPHWGNLAIFYRDFDHCAGLVKLGSIDSSIDALARMSADSRRCAIAERARPTGVSFWRGGRATPKSDATDSAPSPLQGSRQAVPARFGCETRRAPALQKARDLPQARSSTALRSAIWRSCARS
jgi:hypothetical protein